MDWFSRENLNRKPMGFYHQINGVFRLKISHHPILWNDHAQFLVGTTTRKLIINQEGIENCSDLCGMVKHGILVVVIPPHWLLVIPYNEYENNYWWIDTGVYNPSFWPWHTHSEEMFDHLIHNTNGLQMAKGICRG